MNAVIGLRPATSADSQFCYTLHRATLGPYVEAIWGWDEATQLAYHERGFEPTGTRIITVDDHDAGSLSVEYRPGEIYLGRIELHPEYQGRGIGSQLIQTLLDRAAARGQHVVLEVLAVNHRAQALYRRLGFKEVARSGPDSIKVMMRS
jgi:ribosomal protein S18 acetylase RimI-like enzyme